MQNWKTSLCGLIATAAGLVAQLPDTAVPPWAKAIAAGIATCAGGLGLWLAKDASAKPPAKGAAS